MTPDSFARYLRLQTDAAERMPASDRPEYRQAGAVMLAEHRPVTCPSWPVVAAPAVTSPPRGRGAGAATGGDGREQAQGSLLRPVVGAGPPVTPQPASTTDGARPGLASPAAA